MKRLLEFHFEWVLPAMAAARIYLKT